MNEIVNPYNTFLPAQKQQAGNDVEISRAVAEVQGMMVIAKRFPRNPIEATDKILVECQRQGLAEQSLYSYSRGGTEITGPSIRLAEALARNWSNLEYGVKELSQENGQSEMMAFCWDLENNVRHIKVFNVKHERHTKSGSYPLKDARDIYEIAANNAARRLRATILATIPGDIVEAAVAQCEQTLKAKADTSPDALKKLVEAFEKFTVTKDQIEKRIQRRLDTITPAQLIQLRKIYNSLKDGMSAPTDWFQADPTTEPKDLKAKLKAKTEAKPEAEKPPILCPAQKKGVFPAECETCDSKGKCDPFEEFRFEQGQKGAE